MKQNNIEVWNKILTDMCSVQDIDFLDEWGFVDGKLKFIPELPEDFDLNEVINFKDVFKTFKEINQLDLIKQAGLRQKYIDQSLSLNVAFPTPATPK